MTATSASLPPTGRDAEHLRVLVILHHVMGGLCLLPLAIVPFPYAESSP